MLGIISIFLNLFFVPGILAIVWGRRERRENKKAFTGFVCGIVGTAVAAMATLFVVVAAVGPGQVLTNRLLRADFRNGSRPFLTRSTPDYDSDIVDGTYRARSRTGASDPFVSFAMFARTAYAVDMSVDIASASGAGFFGVGCLSSQHEGYVMLAGTQSRSAVVLERFDNRPGSNNHTQELERNETAAVSPTNVRLKLTCRDSLVGSSVTLKGYVNDVEVINATDARGLNGFEAGALVFQSSTPGAEARFSRVDADVTGTGSSR